MKLHNILIVAYSDGVKNKFYIKQSRATLTYKMTVTNYLNILTRFNQIIIEDNKKPNEVLVYRFMIV